MKNIKDNPPLSLYSLRKFHLSKNTDLLVSPTFEKLAKVLLEEIIKENVSKNQYLIREGKLTKKEVKKMVGFNIHIVKNLKDNEWLLVNKDGIYYSRGDSGN